MSMFDEKQRQKSALEEEKFLESFQKLAGVVVGEKNGEDLPKSESLRLFGVMEDLGRCLNVTIPYSTNPEQSEEWYQETVFRPQGIMWRTVQLEDGWYEDAIGVMLGSFTDGTPIALMPAGTRGCLYRDRETGRRIRVTRENASQFQPEATLYYRTFPTRKLEMSDVWEFIRKSTTRPDNLAVVAAAIGVQLLSMISPIMTKLLTSKVVAFQDQNLLTVILFVLLFVSAASFLMNCIESLVTARISSKITLPMQAAFMMRVLTAPASELKSFSAGDLGKRIGSLYNSLKNLMNTVISIVLTMACSLICIPQMLSFAPSLVGIALVVTLGLLVLYIVVIRKEADTSADRQDYEAEESGLTYSLIDGIQKIMLSGAEKRAFTEWTKVFRKSVQTIYDPPFLLKIFSVLTPSVLLAATIAMYAVAAREGVSQSDFYAFLMSYSILTAALTTVSSNATSFADSLPTFRSLKPVMDFVPEVGGDKEVVRHLRGNISLRNVTFSYAENMSPVLENLNVEIKSGEYLAIVGQTGCGKSTVLRLLLGFETPNHGEVLYDGKNIKSLDLTSLRRKIGTVLQNGDLFAGTILSNITIAGKDLTEDDAWEAAEAAGIAEDIRSMPMGMNTPISDGGGGISGGQKQRLLIARAIATKPAILYFDEATSALDNVTQKAVSDSLGEMNCTRLVIAHRLSTVQNCDRILCLNQGHIVEEGSYEELMEKNGFFAELVKKQQI